MNIDLDSSFNQRKKKNNELRISVEELSLIKEEMKNGNDKVVIISNRMEDCIKVEDRNHARRNKEATHSISIRDLEIVNKLKEKMNESKATSKRSNKEN